jgi:hypothetical protein
MKTHVCWAALLGIALAASACGDDGGGIVVPTGVAPGTFRATITEFGTFPGGTVEGTAGFSAATDPATGWPVVTVSLRVVGGGANDVITLTWVGDRHSPPAGTATIADPLSDDLSGRWVGSFRHGNVSLFSESGTVTVTRSEGNRLAGTFSFAATGGSAALGTFFQTAVVGSFDAQAGQIPIGDL